MSKERFYSRYSPAAVKIAFLYSVLSVLWILFSDHIFLILFPDVQLLEIITYKRWLFVATTSGIIFLLIDNEIKRYRKTEDALKASECYLNSIFSAVPVGMGVVSNRVFLSVNDRLCNMTGYSREELIGNSSRMVYDNDEDYELVGREKYRQIHESGTGSVETRWKCKDGRIIDVLLSSSPIASQDLRAGVTFTVLDVTERKHAEKQLQALNDELERKVELRTRELQETQAYFLHSEKLAAIGRLSASIAHEFNSPLQSVLTVLKGVKKTAALEAEDITMLDLAIGESERMKNLIRSLHDFNRPSSDRKVLMDVYQSLESILLLMRSEFKRKKISLEVDFAERLPQIMAVPDQIKQVILNLLNNAVDSCQEHGRVVKIRTWQVQQRIAVAIKDNGIGIQPEKMDQIFQPFYSTKPEVKGTGLGLSICHNIIQNHHGEIRVMSKPGEGSTFTVLIPINGE